MPPTLKDVLSKATVKPQRSGPLWQGPDGEGPQGGITFSLLSRFLVCRERFRVHAIEGLRVRDHFNPRLEFGSMWHVCEEAFAESNDSDGDDKWRVRLQGYVQQLCLRYPLDKDEIAHWYELCKIEFPLYVKHWAQHRDVQARQPLLSERAFDVPYLLPSGRVVRLRGKWDSVDLVQQATKPKGTFRIGDRVLWLQENKTKSQIDHVKVARQLTWDLQTMIYVVAFRAWQQLDDYGTPIRTPETVELPLVGVRYNVVRRSAHKSAGSFEKKITEDIAAGRASEWFARWNVEISAADVDRFRCECLDPILENLIDWWDEQQPPATQSRPTNYSTPLHYRTPFGVYNVLLEGGSTDLDEYINSGSQVGLQQTSNLFPELKEVG